MKVYISNYRNHWVSPYTICEKIFFWREIDYDEPIIEHLTTFLKPFCVAIQKIRDFIHPKIDYVKIDYWDTWSMDSTLAIIILPMLRQLRAEKHGSGLVDLEDVPEAMRYTSTEDYDSQYTFDFYHEPDLQKVQCDIHDRWDWVLDEMIFAFQYKVEESNGKDDENWRENYKRVENGFRLFGKYFQNLWD
jgi:hypothetical protein